MVYILKDIKAYGFSSLEESSKFLLRFLLKARKLKLNIALAGGSTPLYLYFLMSKYDFSNFSFFLTDERYIENTHKDSNYFNVSKFLRVPPIYKTGDIIKDCEEFSSFLEENPVHIAILGIGEDGHSASIFPDKNIPYRCKNALISKAKDYMRISMSEEVLSKVCQIIFFVSKSKKDIVYRFLTKKDTIANEFIKTYHKKPILIFDGFSIIL